MNALNTSLKKKLEKGASKSDRFEVFYKSNEKRSSIYVCQKEARLSLLDFSSYTHVEKYLYTKSQRR